MEKVGAAAMARKKVEASGELNWFTELTCMYGANTESKNLPLKSDPALSNLKGTEEEYNVQLAKLEHPAGRVNQLHSAKRNTGIK